MNSTSIFYDSLRPKKKQDRPEVHPPDDDLVQVNIVAVPEDDVSLLMHDLLDDGLGHSLDHKLQRRECVHICIIFYVCPMKY